MNNTGGKEGLIEVFCTWNKFFLSARAEEKSDAEQNAARATLNKVDIIFFQSLEHHTCQYGIDNLQF